MILLWLILLPLLAGLGAWALGGRAPRAARWVSLLTCVVEFLLAWAIWRNTPADAPYTGGGAWLIQLTWPWVPQLGIEFHLALDGLSLIMVMLTALLGALSVVVSWEEITERVGFFHLNLMAILAGIVGVFLAIDLFLFYCFWELMLVPMYFLISIYGHENRRYAAVKFFLFTQISGLCMLLAILGLYIVHGRTTGVYTFDYKQLLGTTMPFGTSVWLMLGFLAAFLVKLPAFGVHTWLPDAHTEAPTAGSVILAGLMLKTGAYGLLRFVVPLFPYAANTVAPIMMALGVAGILYGAVLAFAQTDFKRLVAYTSVSHLGFVLLGVFAWNTYALQGAVMEMVCHGLSTGALFIIAGFLGHRLGTRDMRQMGGLWAAAPRMGAAAMFFAMASLGLPGLGNFVAEFLVLLGAFRVNPTLAAISTMGLVGATLYSLWLVQKTFLGPKQPDLHVHDLKAAELAVVLVLVAALVFLGVYPQPVIAKADAAITGLETAARTPAAPYRGRAPEMSPRRTPRPAVKMPALLPGVAADDTCSTAPPYPPVPEGRP